MSFYKIHSCIQKHKSVVNWILKLLFFDFVFLYTLYNLKGKITWPFFTNTLYPALQSSFLVLFLAFLLFLIYQLIKSYRISVLNLIAIGNVLLINFVVDLFSFSNGLLIIDYRVVFQMFWITQPFVFMLFVFGCIAVEDNEGEHNTEGKSDLLIDTPINLEDDDEVDTLGYRAQAKIIAEELLKVNNTKDSFTTAINGKWGSGKSSFMALMKKAIKNKEIEKGEILSIVIDFNPWRFDSEKAVIEGYFDELKTALSPYVFGIQPLVSKYVNKLNDVHKHFLFDLILHLFTKKQSTNDLYGLLSSKLKTLDKKVFVFIDDLDRVDEKEIVAIFKLLRNTSNFPNMIFVLGYEKDYINSQLKNVDNRYLEKMVQLEYELNYTEPKYFEDYFFEQLKTLIKPEQIEGLDSRLYESRKLAKELQKSVRRPIKRIEEPSFNSFLKLDNLRQVNRLLNSIQVKSLYKYIVDHPLKITFYIF